MGETDAEEHGQAGGEGWALFTQGTPVNVNLCANRGLGFVQLLVLIACVIGLVTRNTCKPLPVKHAAVPPHPSRK